jgi:hypothetical protein
MIYLFRKGELKSSPLLDRKRANCSPPEKKHHNKKERLLTLILGFEAEGRDDVDDGEDVREPVVLT